MPPPLVSRLARLLGNTVIHKIRHGKKNKFTVYVKLTLRASDKGQDALFAGDPMAGGTPPD